MPATKRRTMTAHQTFAYRHALTGDNRAAVGARYCVVHPGGWAVCLSFNK